MRLAEEPLSPSNSNVPADSIAGDPSGRYRLRLFVAGNTPRSVRAIRNIRAICDDNLRGLYDLEVVDIYQCPEQMQAEQIVVIPTLLKAQPLPVRRLVGDLSDHARVLLALDLDDRHFDSSQGENELGN